MLKYKYVKNGFKKKTYRIIKKYYNFMIQYLLQSCLVPFQQFMKCYTKIIFCICYCLNDHKLTSQFKL